MEENIQELRQLGHKRLNKFCRIISDFPKLSLKVLELFYSRREPLNISTVSVFLRANRRETQYLLEKLLELEILEIDPLAPKKRKNQKLYVMSRLGLEVFKEIAPIISDFKIIEALGVPHTVEILSAFPEGRDVLWSRLQKDSHLLESSLSRVLHAIEEANLIAKAKGGYYLTDKGKEMKETISRLSRVETPPAYEVQVKIPVTSLDDLIYRLEEDAGEQLSVSTVEQEDYYLVPSIITMPLSYLRYRIDHRIDSVGRALGMPKHTLSWTLEVEPSFEKGIRILRRKREDVDAPYPAILFFLEYCGVRVKKKVFKIRRTVKVKIGQNNLELHFDQLKSIRKNRDDGFLEIKGIAKSAEEAQMQCQDILKLMEKLRLSESMICRSLYFQFLD